jgi:hypothetical protein
MNYSYRKAFQSLRRRGRRKRNRRRAIEQRS